MLDKKIIKSNFKKSLNTYDNDASVQKQMAKKLVSLVSDKENFDSILEIGSYTGLLTKEVTKNFDFKSYLALDLIDSFDFIRSISPKIKFLNKDIDEFETNEKFDLIISSACLQWSLDFKKTIEKLKSYLKPGGILAISIFGVKNLYEIKETFNTGLNYLPIEDIRKIFPKGKVFDETIILSFKTPLEILRHLKYTGVNSISKNSLSVGELKQKMEILSKVYKNRLTYNPLYIINQE